jgi:hypothetical protein
MNASKPKPTKSVDELKAIIRGGSEAATREKLADLQGRIDRLNTELSPLVKHRDELKASLATIDAAKADLAALTADDNASAEVSKR